MQTRKRGAHEVQLRAYPSAVANKNLDGRRHKGKRSRFILGLFLLCRVEDVRVCTLGDSMVRRVKRIKYGNIELARNGGLELLSISAREA